MTNETSSRDLNQSMVDPPASWKPEAEYKAAPLRPAVVQSILNELRQHADSQESEHIIRAGYRPWDAMRDAAKLIEQQRDCLSETLSKAELPSYSAELLAANHPTRTDSILSGPYTPAYIAAQQIERLRKERDAARETLVYVVGILDKLFPGMDQCAPAEAIARKVAKRVTDEKVYAEDCRAALFALYEAARVARWPLTAEQMLPMNEARRALAKNPNPSGQSTAEASHQTREASGPVGLGPKCGSPFCWCANPVLEIGQHEPWTCDGCKATFANPVNGLCPKCGCNLIDKAEHDPADPLYWKTPSGPVPVLAVGTGNADTARLNWLDEMWLPMEIAPGQVENRARWWSDKLHLTIREAVDAAMPPQTIPSQGIVKSDGPEA